MKLKEPLQGINMISGHIISHFAMFMIASRINISKYNLLKPTDTDYIEMKDELIAFNYIKYGHLITGILQMLGIQLKHKRQFVYA